VDLWVARGDEARWMRRIVRLVAVPLSAAILATAACGGSAQAATPTSSSATIPAHVTFKVSDGTFVATHNQGAGNTTQATDSFGFSVSYPAEIDADGLLAITGPGAYGSIPGNGTSPNGLPIPGTYHFTDSFYNVDCRGTIPLDPGAASPAGSVSTTTPQTLGVQSLTGVDLSGNSGYEGCQGAPDQNGNSFDGQGEAANNVGVFELWLPDIFSARLTIPPGALDRGSYTKEVTSADAVAQVPSSCSDEFPGGTCSMSLTWSGEVDITADNCHPYHLRARVCVGPKQKKDAASDLTGMQADDAAANATEKSVCSKAGGSFKNRDGKFSGLALCLGVKAAQVERSSEESNDQEVMADPPDSNYNTVAVPHLNDARTIAKVKRTLPRFAVWLHHEDRIDAIYTAMTTSLNRAASASAAGATSALTLQTTAIARYAQQLGPLMRSQPPRARAAARELRALTGTRGARAVARRLAALLADAKLLASRTKLGGALELIGK
jgi:hypothetical protein